MYQKKIDRDLKLTQEIAKKICLHLSNCISRQFVFMSFPSLSLSLRNSFICELILISVVYIISYISISVTLMQLTSLARIGITTGNTIHVTHSGYSPILYDPA